jgi:hypothetical protein
LVLNKKFIIISQQVIHYSMTKKNWHHFLTPNLKKKIISICDCGIPSTYEKC